MTIELADLGELPSATGLYGSMAELMPDAVMSDLVIAIAVAVGT